nr:ribonuclease H-like domain, reverse transcriptase, RNA-dependent DNA polymerase [Tanacetum cinerariifolium]
KDRASVASDFKVLLNGSKTCGGNTQCSDLFFDIPRTHGRLRSLCKLIHSSTRVELNSIPSVLGAVLMQFIKGRLQSVTSNIDVSSLPEKLSNGFLSFLDLKDASFDQLLQKVKEIVASNESRRLPKIPKGTRDFLKEQMACDFDIVGDDTIRADFEVVKILTKLLDELNISEYEIDEKGLDIKVVDNISPYVNLRGHPLELLFELKKEGSQFLTKDSLKQALNDLDKLFQALDSARCVHKVVLDLSLAIGLNYLSLIYEAVIKGATQEQSNLILEDDEPSLLMTTHETEYKEVLLNEGKIQPGKYATTDTSIWYLDNGASNHMMGTKSHFRDIDESIIGRDWDNNGKEKSTQDTFWASFVVEGADNENPTPVNAENNDNTYQEYEPITDLDSPITPPTYTYNLNSEEEEEATIIETETLLFMEEEPRNYKEASTDKKWIEAMEIELDLINKNNTWTLTTLPMNQKAIGLKWVFMTKRDAKGKIINYNAQLIAKGYVQEQGIDFDEVFALVAQIETVRLILALAAYHGWQVHHLDVKSAFLHEDLKEEVYVTQPEGFIQQGNSGKVYKLIKALYGLRQAPRAWNVKLDQTLKSLDFKNEIELFKSQMEDKFEMSNLGLLAYYLGIKVTQTGRVITIIQTSYINKILKETSMMESNDTKITMDPGTKLVKAEDGNSVDATYYRSLIGSLRYLQHTRPDLSYSVRILSRFMQDPKDHHLKAAKQVIRHIKGTKEHGIIYKKEGGYKITGYNDSSYGINTDQGKGTTGIVIYFGESPITWCTQKQPTVALLSCESEFMAATRAACQALWLKRLLSEITCWEEERITLKVDNISAIALVRNPVFHEESKHIDIRYHFIHECVENGHINVEHISGELQRADILTKALPRLKFVTMRQMLGVQDLRRSNDRD